jgi:hypothetical protein
MVSQSLRDFANAFRSTAKGVPANAPSQAAKQRLASPNHCNRSISRLQRVIMTQPPMRQQNRLGALQVSVARHDSFACGSACSTNAVCKFFNAECQLRNRAQHPQTKISCHLVVAASACVEFARGIADQFGQSSLDGGVDIFVGGGEGKLSRRKFFSDGIQPE